MNKRKYLIDNFIRPWMVDVSILQKNDVFEDECLDEFFNLLHFPTLKPIELRLRSLIDFLFLNTDSKLKLKITDFVKFIRNPNRALKINYPLDEKFNQYVFRLKKKLGYEEFLWNGKRGAVCLSHDVDTLGGYKFSPEVMQMDFDHGIPSVFNLVTCGDYTPDSFFVSELVKTGFEVGFHGYRHELGLAGRPIGQIRYEFKQGLTLLRGVGAEVKGFRAPAFSVNSEILSVLEESNFTYDSSIQLCNGHYHSCGISFPYKYPGKNIWEIPLSVQDDLFFRDSRLSEKESLNIIEKILVQTIELGGVVSFNFHPCLIRDRVRFYKTFLEMLTGYSDDVWLVLPKDLCCWMDKEIDKKIK